MDWHIIEPININIIFFSIFFLRRRIFSCNKCILYAAFGRLLRESGQFGCCDGDAERTGKGKGVCGHNGKVGVLCM